jgi:hypothetical protein
MAHRMCLKAPYDSRVEIPLKRRLVFVIDMHEVSAKYLRIRIINYEICLLRFNVGIFVMTVETDPVMSHIRTNRASSSTETNL